MVIAVRHYILGKKATIFRGRGLVHKALGSVCLCSRWVGEWSAREGMFQAKGSEWACRTGPDAGESGQLLPLTTTQHVSRRERR